MKNMLVLAVIVVLALILLPKDKVNEDKEHKVICVSRGTRLLGCMDTWGNQVSNEHANHKSKPYSGVYLYR